VSSTPSSAELDSDPNAPAPGRPSGADHPLAGFAPELVELTDVVLFGRVWPGAELAPRDRSLITVACLVATGSVDQLPYHLGRARDNGVTEAELVAAITHLAFYAGWPRAMTAMTAAQQVFLASPDAG
jgi:4-carboxymuconolactone decarboxylase